MFGHHEAGGARLLPHTVVCRQVRRAVERLRDRDQGAPFKGSESLNGFKGSESLNLAGYVADEFV